MLDWRAETRERKHILNGLRHVESGDNSGGPDDPDAPGTPGRDLEFAVQQSELVIQKTKGNAFSEPEPATWSSRVFKVSSVCEL